MHKKRTRLLLTFGLVVVAAGVLLITFDWTWFKGPIEQAASSALGRKVEIQGELDVDVSAAPSITLEQVRIANAEWGSRPSMLTVAQVEFAIDLWPLLQGDIELPFLHVEQPDLLLETNEQGQGNWQFGAEPTGPPAIPIIRDLRVSEAEVRYHDLGGVPDLAASLATVDGKITGTDGIELAAEGTFEERPLALTVNGGAPDQLSAEAKRFPFQISGRLGASRLSVVGSAEQLFEASGLSAEIALQSDEPGALLAMAGLPERALGGLDIDLALTRDDRVWALHDIEARLGESDLGGSLSFDPRGEEPAISADLRSEQIRAQDTRPLVELLTGPDAAKQPDLEAALADARQELEAQSAAGLPASLADLGLSREMLPQIDAEVSYTIGQLLGPDLALRDIDLHARLKDRLPVVSLAGQGQYQGVPVEVDVQVGEAAMDGKQAYPVRVDVAAAGTEIEAEGGLAKPAELAGLRLRFDVSSQDLDPLLSLLDVEAPQIPPFEVHGRITQEGDRWQLTGLDGRLGESDIRGSAGIALGQAEPLITADLASDQVRVQDLQPLLDGFRPEQSDPEAAVDAALAEARAALERGAPGPGGLGLSRDMLPEIDIELSYTVGSFSGPEFSLADLALYGRLEDGMPRLTVTGGGEYRNTPVTLDVAVGPEDGSETTGGDYPVRALIQAAATEIDVRGEIGKPKTLDGLDLKVQVASEDINDVLALADVELPQIPPFLISGQVAQDGQVWRVADFYGQFSESELAGQIAVDLSDRRPFITADLQSSRLLISDLMTAGDKAAAIEDRLGEDQPAKRSDEPAVISARGINFNALPEIDADVSFEGGFVDLPEFTFERLRFDLSVRDQIAVLDASGEGDFRNGPIRFAAQAGTADNLTDPEAPYPVDFHLESRRTEISLDGTVSEPGRQAGLDVDVALEGPNLDRLGEILQLSLPTTPPFTLQSHLSHDANVWTLTALQGTIGDSDVQGQATIMLGGVRPTLEADLTSQNLDFDDLGLLVGAPPDPEETVSVRQERRAAIEAAERGVLPDEPFAVPELRAMDARVTFTGENVKAGKLPLQQIVIDLTLEDGQLRFEPLRLEVAGGALESVVGLDARKDTLVGNLEVDVRRIELNRLLADFGIDFAAIDVERKGSGTLAGQAQFDIQGNSIQELAASADGQLTLIVDGGRINALLVEAIGLDLGEALGLLVEGEEGQADMVPLDCFVARFDVQSGVMETEALVLATSDSTITGTGQIDLGQESLSLQLLAHPEDASVLTASTPVRIEGTFENPEIDVVSEDLKEKVFSALGLGVVLPLIGAAIPFIESGDDDGAYANCAGLISAAMEGGAGSERDADTE